MITTEKKVPIYKLPQGSDMYDLLAAVRTTMFANCEPGSDGRFWDYRVILQEMKPRPEKIQELKDLTPGSDDCVDLFVNGKIIRIKRVTEEFYIIVQ